MNLPPHNAQFCVGIDLNGIREECTERVEPGSMFPHCPRHRKMLATMPRRRTCAGARTYDHVMRPVQIPCVNLTGHQDERLCASCRVIEAREKEKAKAAFEERCPSCGRSGPRPQVHQRVQRSDPSQGRSPPSSGQPRGDINRDYPQPQQQRRDTRPFSPHSRPTRPQSSPERAPFQAPSQPARTEWSGPGVTPYRPPTRDED